MANAPSVPENSKICSTFSRLHTIARRVPGSSDLLMPTSTANAVESMNVTFERSMTTWQEPPSSASTSIHFKRGAVERSSSPSTEITHARSSRSRLTIANPPTPGGDEELDVSTRLSMYPSCAQHFPKPAAQL